MTADNTKITAATSYFPSSCVTTLISSQQCFNILCSRVGEVKTHFMVVQPAFTWDTCFDAHVNYEADLA